MRACPNLVIARPCWAGDATAVDYQVISAAILHRLDLISTAEVTALAAIERVPGARNAADDVSRSMRQSTFFPTAGLRLANRAGGMVIDDMCTSWARWAWHFTEPGWQAAEEVVDDALAVLGMADRLPVDLVTAVVAPVMSTFFDVPMTDASDRAMAAIFERADRLVSAKAQALDAAVRAEPDLLPLARPVIDEQLSIWPR